MSHYEAHAAANWEEIESLLEDLGFDDEASAKIKVVFDAEVEKKAEEDFVAAQERRADGP